MASLNSFSDAAFAALTPRHQRLITHIRVLGGTARTVECLPHVMLRHFGIRATPESVALVINDLAQLEHLGMLLALETPVGVMVMLIVTQNMPVPLTCDRLVTMYSWLNENERNMLGTWEHKNVGQGGKSTTDWPAWPTIYRRRYS